MATIVRRPDWRRWSMATDRTCPTMGGACHFRLWTSALPGPAGTAVVALSAGDGFTCALLQPGSAVRCWGLNSQGRLGQGNTDNRGDDPGEMGATLTAVDLGPGLTPVQLAAGRRHACAVLQPGGLVKCWGDNSKGQLGRLDTGERGRQPGQMGARLPTVDMGPGLTAAALAAGEEHTCALLQPGGVVKCWGSNRDGQLGAGNTQRRGMYGTSDSNITAVDLGPGAEAAALAVGHFFSCALLRQGGQVKCWGDNSYGQLGQGDTTNRGDRPGQMGANLPPVDLGPGLTAVAVAAGRCHVCAVLQPGDTVKCWGCNTDGQLGAYGANRGRRPGEMGAALPPVDLETL